MALTTYAELQTAVADFLNRDDLASTATTFIALAEADMNRRVRHWRMEARATGTLSSRYLGEPTGWLEAHRMALTTGGITRLEPMSLADMLERRGSTDDTSGRPRYFAMANGDFEFWPTPDGSYEYELIYYTRIPALSVAAPTNWMLEYHPDAYLYGALVHSAPYLVDDGRVGTWGSFYNAAIEAIQQESERAKAGGSGLRIKSRAFV